MGIPNRRGLAFAGLVEAGLGAERESMRALLALIATKRSPFGKATASRRARFVEPRLEAVVRFVGRDENLIREATLERLRAG